MRLSDDGKTLVVLSSYYARKNDGIIEESLLTGWDSSTHKLLFRRRLPLSHRLILSGDTRVMAGQDSPRLSRLPFARLGPMRLENVATGESLLTFPTLKGQTWPLEFSPDGRFLASNNSNWEHANKDDPNRQTLRLWETATAAEVLSLPAADFNRTAFSRDGRLLAFAAPAREIVVWDLARGIERHRFKGFDAEVIDLRFSPDGRRLISGLGDSTLLVWKVETSGIGPVSKLGPKGLAKAWDELAGSDAPCAFRARGALAASPEEALPWLKEHLHPARAIDAKRLHQLLADLDNDQFRIREKAQADLQELGELAEPALRQALAQKPVPEVRQRLETVLGRLRGPVMQPEKLRLLRAVAILEEIGTPAAHQLLEDLSQGTPEAWLTREAKASLRRLERRSAPL
jgi:hypothetical protein